MVVISLPSTVETGVWQDRVGCPPIWTVQALHWPTPHAYLLPIRSRVSLRTQRRGVSGETSTEVDFPLTQNETGMVGQLRGGGVGIEDKGPDETGPATSITVFGL